MKISRMASWHRYLVIREKVGLDLEIHGIPLDTPSFGVLSFVV